MERSFERFCQDNGIELVESGEFVGESSITRSTGDTDLVIDGVGGVSSSGGSESSTSSESLRPVVFNIIDSVFYSRLADSGWFRSGETYFVGEWFSDDLPEFLSRLLSVEFDIALLGPLAQGLMKVARSRPCLDGPDMAGELPASLLELYSGELLMGGSSLFASGV